MSRQRELVDQLNTWAYEYYVLDAPTVSDKEYDALYDELKRLEAESGEVYPDSPTRRVGGEPLKGFEKYTHIAPLFSLDKSVTEEELQAFITRTERRRVNALCTPRNINSTGLPFVLPMRAVCLCARRHGAAALWART